ncbi:MAG: hypothetical protein KatS3mg092_0896 [Patescibacteria group bacterium]|nr:MAG: hypothetical protein KatS3mg092_0896 [Patescibacteria group bacterium]
MRYKINLLPEKEKKFLDKLTFFALNYLRYIIVITQLVVIGVFFYRFQLDQQVIDLREEVNQKKEIVQVILPLLNEAARIDTKTKEIEKILNNQNKFKSMFDYVMSIIPESVRLISLEVKNQSLTLNGNTTNSKQLQAFFNLLKKDKKFKHIELKNIKRTETGYDFIINLSDFL